MAVFAGGCFWCTEADFDKVPGVLATTSGYTGGKTANPTYAEVSSHTTGHAEAVQVVMVDDFYRKGCGRDARLQQLWGDQAKP